MWSAQDSRPRIWNPRRIGGYSHRCYGRLEKLNCKLTKRSIMLYYKCSYSIDLQVCINLQ